MSPKPIGRLLATAIFAAAMPALSVVQALDDTGAAVTLATPAQRIVSLAPHATELLVAAGAGARIVGAVAAGGGDRSVGVVAKGSGERTVGGGGATAATGTESGGSKAVNVGDARSLDLERIVALQPDLIVTWPYTVPAQVEALAARGAKVFVADPATIDGIATDIERLGALAGTDAHARAAAVAFRDRIARLRSGRSAARPIRVFYEIWNAPLYTVGGRHLVSEAIRVCGGENVFAALALPAPSVTVEAVLAARPEAIVAGGDGGARPAWLDDWKRWPAIPAVASGSLLAVNADYLHRAGPRFVDGVEQLCAALDAARRNSADR
jgi:iron complex transport system substrate-binding protein